mmetsp:Transcript_22263/g.30500  ORF Transcript_22263/g.30500 Transcript_22263/m.30500 type:complete len:244 (-) Transcript_22263:698-1429(-)
MLSKASVCLVDSWRMSSGMRASPNTATLRMVSTSGPSATSLKPVDMSERCISNNGSINSLDFRIGFLLDSKAPGGTGTAVEFGVIFARFRSAQWMVSFKRASKTFNRSLYGSRELLVTSLSSCEQVRSDIEALRVAMSFLKRVAAIQRDSMDTSRVMGGVTFGLPSLSPPIQEAILIGAISSGSDSPHSVNTTSFNLRKKAGTEDHNTFSTMARPVFASSTGVGFLRRRSSESQMHETSAAIS